MKKKRLLIVDDEAGIREILAFKAESLGAEIFEAENGQVALDLIKSQTFEVVLSDINMPVMTGMQLLKSIRELGNMVPFVILSAYGDKKQAVEALKLGAFDFIDKPWEDQNLLDVLYRALELGAELNFWKSDNSIANALYKVGEVNSEKALAQVLRTLTAAKLPKD